MALAPSRVTLRTYQVGFGDCFLLTFHYPSKRTAHVLIDFGSTKLPKTLPSDHMVRVAKDIAARCRGKLHVVVATHRHRDHISGFATNAKGNGPGDIIRGLKPDFVIQPWTEDPKAAKNAKQATRLSAGDGKGVTSFVASLEGMHSLAGAAVAASTVLRRQMALGTVPRTLVEQLEFIGEDNLKNLEAVKNLMTMGGRGVKRYYVNTGAHVNLSKVLPGVKVHVLGPPNLVQSRAVEKQKSRDKDEFWHLFGAAPPAAAGRAKQPGRLFPRAFESRDSSTETMWFRRRIGGVWGEQLLSLVRSLDKVMNNTSVILLFEVKGALFLFPGDAQLENWQYALAQKKYRDLLGSVNVYKVGHHGSLNATPKSLWELFRSHRGGAKKRNRLKSVVSTMAGKHGSRAKHTEVPRKTLMVALDEESTLFSTQKLKGQKFFEDIELL